MVVGKLHGETLDAPSYRNRDMRQHVAHSDDAPHAYLTLTKSAD